jgi:hypothetical protein
VNGRLPGSGGQCRPGSAGHIGAAGRLRGLDLHALARQIRQRDGASVAQKIQTLYIDDLDGTEAEGTVRFGLDGIEYEIDLNAEHAQALRHALARYVHAARRAGGGTRRPARSRRGREQAG